MRNRFLSSVSVMTVVIASILIVSATLAGQASTPLRTSWGAPDLQGVWDFRTLTPLERSKELAGKPFLTAAEAAEFEQTTARQKSVRSMSRSRPTSSATTTSSGSTGEQR